MSRLPPRVSIIQSELDRFHDPRYLEIGIFDGLVFLQVEAKSKVAVDPEIRIPRVRRLRAAMDRRVEVREMPSDEYFSSLDPSVTFDVVFVDGLHLYEQALRDIENALRHLSDDGVVLVHDCNPTAEAVASRNPEDASRSGHRAWCGDVWKAIVHLRATRADLEVSVLDTDFGIGVVKEGEGGPSLDLNPAEIAALEYSDLVANRELFLGLEPAPV